MALYVTGFVDQNGEVKQYDYDYLANAPVKRGTGENSTISVHTTSPNIASGVGSTAIGVGNQSIARGALTLGANNIASAQNAIAIGNQISNKDNNQATAIGAVAIGSSNKATGVYSVAMGREAEASGGVSVSIGYLSAATGAISLATGSSTEASARYSSAFGNSTKATGGSSFVAGAFNVPDANDIDETYGQESRKYLMILGNGTDDANRSNALTVDWNGNLEVSGDISSNGYSLSEITSVLKEGNLNQKVKTNPFVLYADDITFGSIRPTRSTCTVEPDGSIISTFSYSSSYASFGFFIDIGCNNVASHKKILVSVRGLSQSIANFKNWRLLFTVSGSAVSSQTANFTESDYDYIAEFDIPAGLEKYQVTFLAIRNSASQETSDYFEIGSMQIFDLTEMFGEGNEPSIKLFKELYPEVYPFHIPKITVGTKPSEFLINKYLSDFSIVTDIESLYNTTSSRVLVLNNNHENGDGGPCYFYTRDGETAKGITRSDGTTVYPMPNQGVLRGGLAPRNKIMDVIESYVGNTNLIYGNTKTLYDDVCSNEMDCSTFVTAVLNGVTYNNSRYVLGTTKTNIMGEYVGDTHLADFNGQWGRLKTNAMAQWFAMHKQLYELPHSAKQAVHMLQFGDILFSGTTSENYFGNDHCAIVIGVIPDSLSVIVAQCGGSGWKNNEATAVKTSCRVLTDELVTATFRIFARPSYAPDYYDNGWATLLNSMQNGNYIFSKDSGVFFQQNTVLSSTTGRMTKYETYSATPDYYEVIPGKAISYIGQTNDASNIPYVCAIAQYDEVKNFISLNYILRGTGEMPVVTLNSRTKFIRFEFGHLIDTDAGVKLSDFKDFKASMSFD